MKLNARQLRILKQDAIKEELKKRQTRPIYLILENIYDTYNIGGLFRLADAIGAEKIYLCGQCEIPPNPKIKKASIGTYKIVPWEYRSTVKEAIKEIRSKIKDQRSKRQIKVQKDERLNVIAVEQSSQSICYTGADYSLPLALIVGNETFGVLPETLKLADQIVEIPMWGINKSLNVIVSAATVSYWAMHQLKT